MTEPYPYPEPEVPIDPHARCVAWRIAALFSTGVWMGVFLAWWLY